MPKATLEMHWESPGNGGIHAIAVEVEKWKDIYDLSSQFEAQAQEEISKKISVPKDLVRILSTQIVELSD